MLASSSVITAPIQADELDRLSITLCTDMSTAESGALCLLYDRVRAEG